MKQSAIQEWLNGKEAYELIGCSRSTFYRLVQRGQIRKRRLPVQRKYWAEDVRKVSELPPQPQGDPE